MPKILRKSFGHLKPTENLGITNNFQLGIDQLTCFEGKKSNLPLKFEIESCDVLDSKFILSQAKNKEKKRFSLILKKPLPFLFWAHLNCSLLRRFPDPKPNNCQDSDTEQRG